MADRRLGCACVLPLTRRQLKLAVARAEKQYPRWLRRGGSEAGMCVRSTAYAASAKVGCGAGRKAVSGVAVAWWIGGWDARAFYRLRGVN